jgi:hypothetical protein
MINCLYIQQRIFDLLSESPFTRDSWITMAEFRLCSTSRSHSQVGLYHYAHEQNQRDSGQLSRRLVTLSWFGLFAKKTGLIWLEPTIYTYRMMEIQVYIVWYMCLNRYNSVYEMYRELQWRFSKINNCGGVSQIVRNCSGIYLNNPCIKHTALPQLKLTVFYRFLLIHGQENKRAMSKSQMALSSNR